MILNNVGLLTSSLLIDWPGGIAEIVLSTDESRKLVPGPDVETHIRSLENRTVAPELKTLFPEMAPFLGG